MAAGEDQPEPSSANGLGPCPPRDVGHGKGSGRRLAEHLRVEPGRSREPRPGDRPPPGATAVTVSQAAGIGPNTDVRGQRREGRWRTHTEDKSNGCLQSPAAEQRRDDRAPFVAERPFQPGPARLVEVQGTPLATAIREGSGPNFQWSSPGSPASGRDAVDCRSGSPSRPG